MNDLILKDQRFNFELNLKMKVIEILKDYGYKFFLRNEEIVFDYPLSYCVYDEDIIIKTININTPKSNFELVFNTLKLLKALKINECKINVKFGANVSVKETQGFIDIINEMLLQDLFSFENTKNEETIVEFISNDCIVSGVIFSEISYITIGIKNICTMLYKEKDENNKNKTLVHYNKSSVFNAQNAINELRKSGLFIEVSLYENLEESLEFAKKSGFGGIINFVDDNIIKVIDIEENREIQTTIEELLEQ